MCVMEVSENLLLPAVIVLAINKNTSIIAKSNKENFLNQRRNNL